MKKKLFYILLPVLTIFTILAALAGYGYFTAKSFTPNITALQETGTKLSVAFQAQDLVAAKTESQALRKQIDELDSKYQKLKWTTVIPFLGNYSQDGQH